MRSGVRGWSVLVVEDDPALRALYRSALVAAGYSVVAVEDGMDALLHLERNPAPDAMVLDLALPRLSGLDLAREMKAHSKTAGVRIVVVTGILGIDTELLEFDCVFHKPISPDELVVAVDSCIRKSRRS